MRIPTCKVDPKRYQHDHSKFDCAKGIASIRSDLYMSDLANKAILDRIELQLDQFVSTSESLKAKVDDLHKRRLKMIYVAALIGLLWGVLLDILFFRFF